MSFSLLYYFILIYKPTWIIVCFRSDEKWWWTRYKGDILILSSTIHHMGFSFLFFFLFLFPSFFCAAVLYSLLGSAFTWPRAYVCWSRSRDKFPLWFSGIFLGKVQNFEIVQHYFWFLHVGFTTKSLLRYTAMRRQRTPCSTPITRTSMASLQSSKRKKQQKLQVRSPLHVSTLYLFLIFVIISTTAFAFQNRASKCYISFLEQGKETAHNPVMAFPWLGKEWSHSTEFNLEESQVWWRYNYRKPWHR